MQLELVDDYNFKTKRINVVKTKSLKNMKNFVRKKKTEKKKLLGKKKRGKKNSINYLKQKLLFLIKLPGGRKDMIAWIKLVRKHRGFSF